jgi:hypothetical protein
MIGIDQLERQHGEIDKAMAAAMLAIDAGDASSSATSLATMLGDISRLIGSHLKIEDTEVYPILVESIDPDVSRTAQQFRDNMSGIALEFQAYVERYKVLANVTCDAPRFGYETRRIFDRIRYRMRREEVDLYPLLARPDHAAFGAEPLNHRGNEFTRRQP